MAMLAKEECAALPVFLLLMDISRGVKLRRGPLGAMFAIALALGLRTVWAAAVTAGSQAGAQAGISPASYLAAEGPVILGYLQMLVLPWGFSVDYSSVPAPLAWRMAAWVGVAALAVAASRRFKGLAMGFWFLGGLVLLAPSSSIFPAADLANDRRMYLPLMAFSACAALLLQRADGRVLLGGAVALAAITAYYTNLRRSPEALWSEAVRRAPEKVRPRLQLARAVAPQQALEILKQAQQMAPDDAGVAAEQGRILLEIARPAEALAAFGRALALDPGDARTLNNRGAALAALGAARGSGSGFHEGSSPRRLPVRRSPESGSYGSAEAGAGGVPLHGPAGANAGGAMKPRGPIAPSRSRISQPRGPIAPSRSRLRYLRD
jgi:hypothetical protein